MQGTSATRQTTPKIRDRRKTGPLAGPGPAEHVGSDGGTRAIIFVGGHAAGPSKQALNPQPIPPGHAMPHGLAPQSLNEARGH